MDGPLSAPSTSKCVSRFVCNLLAHHLVALEVTVIEGELDKYGDGVVEQLKEARRATQHSAWLQSQDSE